jgi:hypothetical protein
MTTEEAKDKVVGLLFVGITATMYAFLSFGFAFALGWSGVGAVFGATGFMICAWMWKHVWE